MDIYILRYMGRLEMAPRAYLLAINAFNKLHARDWMWVEWGIGGLKYKIQVLYETLLLYEGQIFGHKIDSTLNGVTRY